MSTATPTPRQYDESARRALVDRLFEILDHLKAQGLKDIRSALRSISLIERLTRPAPRGAGSPPVHSTGMTTALSASPAPVSPSPPAPPRALAAAEAFLTSFEPSLPCGTGVPPVHSARPAPGSPRPSSPANLPGTRRPSAAPHNTPPTANLLARAGTL